MNNFHIYEEVGRGKDSVVYKVSTLKIITNQLSTFIVLFRVAKRRRSSMSLSSQLRSSEGEKS